MREARGTVTVCELDYEDFTAIIYEDEEADPWEVSDLDVGEEHCKVFDNPWNGTLEIYRRTA